MLLFFNSLRTRAHRAKTSLYQKSGGYSPVKTPRPTLVGQGLAKERAARSMGGCRSAIPRSRPALAQAGESISCVATQACKLHSW